MSQKIKDVNFAPHWIELSKLSPHPRIQQAFRLKYAEAIKRNFKPRVLGPINVVPNSTMDGHYWVWDGQHRLWVLKALFGSNQTALCWVYSDLEEKELAELQRLFNKRKSWNAIDLFRMAVISEDETALEITKILKASSLKPGMHGGDSGISAVAALQSTYKRLGPIDFSRMIVMLKAAWGDDLDAYTTVILSGAAHFVGKYNGLADLGSLSERLMKFGTPGKFLGHARTHASSGGMTTSRAAAELMTNLYNKGRTPPNRLA
jgi:hypothetical protein